MQRAKRQPESAAPLRHTTVCFYFARGLCDRGASCTYAHSASDLRPKPDLSRTSLCRTFMRAGLCTAGEECMFAHGRAELRRPRKKQAAASGTTSGKQPAKHQEMSAGQYEPVTGESGRRSYDDNSGSILNGADSNVEPSGFFGNATCSEASGSCSAGWDVDGAEFETAPGNNLVLLPPLLVHRGFGCTIKTVKNTFLHFEERVGAAMIPTGRMAKSCSAPQLLAA
eukprot:CAMPEP_0115096520 /NCGR_PEP_ID=MMETSP0227-20121206/29779_1 /TAXON_ID=89957 /ORGANISM="Polarella glacialis, Strain CCMP 1383" /LENGTH=225 /DNA_ID=CAMNT_0002490283 /DNA_START=103 /DNA_END=781 /DNA_ORIENTATION=-